MEAIRALILSPLLGGPPYLALATLLIACSIGFPFSSDITLITAGVLASTGVFSLLKTIVIAWASILIGDSITFFAGRKYGHALVQHRYFRRLCSRERYEEISGFLTENASKFIFTVRFTPAMRSVIFLTAGTIQVRPRTFYAMNILSTSIYVPILVSLAYYTANQADALIAQFQSYSRIIMTVVALALAAAIYYRRRVLRSRYTFR